MLLDHTLQRTRAVHGVVAALREEFTRLQREEVEWLKLVGASRYNQQQARQDAYRYQGIAGAFGDLAGIARSAGSSDFIQGLFKSSGGSTTP